MTDSVKRVIFGNILPENNLKIEINCAFNYIEKEKEKNNKLNYSTNTNKKIKDMRNLKDMRSSGTFSHKNILTNKKSGISTNSNIKKHYSNSKSNKNINVKSPKITKPKTHMFNYGNNEEININNINMNNKTKENKEIKKNEIKDNKDIKNDNIEDESVIDDELNKEIKENNYDFYNYINDFKEKHPLEKLDSINDINELNEQSKNIILELLDYQMKFYSIVKEGFSTKNKLKNLMLKYNEKLRNTKKEINKIDEMLDLCEINSEILDKNENKNIESLLSLKENELNNYNNICSNKAINKENNKEDNSELIEKGKNVLIKVLQQCIEKHGPINNIYTLTNSTEPERVNIKKLADKYNLQMTSEIKEEEEEKNDEKDNNNINLKENKEQSSLNENDEKIDNYNNNDINNDEQDIEKEDQKEKNIYEGKITKWEYVSTEKPDKIDKKLELYLKYFYSKRTFPIVIFKKTSTNNYEYGKQKIMIKIEGDTIRVRHLGGYLIIDKFIELNAAIEEKKLKKLEEKNNNANNTQNKKKENIQKKKTK